VTERILLPLAIYLAITLGVPLANGAAARIEFWHHMTEVVVVAALLLAFRGLVAAQGSIRAGQERYESARLSTFLDDDSHMTVLHLSSDEPRIEATRPGSRGFAGWASRIQE
jgi:hypothetical protein